MVAEHSAANGRDRLLQRVVDVLPFAGLRITEMDRFGVNDRLMAVAAQIENFDVLFAQGSVFTAHSVGKHFIQAFVLVLLSQNVRNLVFHVFLPFSCED